MTSKFCVVGSPIKHSLSPIIHKAAYAHLGLNFSYERIEVPLGGLGAVMEDQAFSGLSVTMPLKYEAFELSDSYTPEAEKTGVVNTLVRSSNGWVGHNTDVLGFAKCFHEVPDPQRITIVGSGATARSAALAISRVFPAAKPHSTMQVNSKSSKICAYLVCAVILLSLCLVFYRQWKS